MFSQPQGWFGLREPSRAFSAIVRKDGSTVWAEDASGKTIASGEAGVDDASVIQSALDSLAANSKSPFSWENWFESQTGSIYLCKGQYLLNKTIKILGNNIGLVSDCACLIPVNFQDLQPVIQIGEADTETSAYYNRIEGIFIKGSGKEAGISNIYNGAPIIRNVNIYKVRRGLVFERCWGDHGIISNCGIMAAASSSDGAIHFVPSESGYNNHVLFYKVHVGVSSGYEGYSLYMEQKAVYGGIEFIDCHLGEPQGDIYIDSDNVDISFVDVDITSKAMIKGNRVCIKALNATNLDLLGNRIKADIFYYEPSDTMHILGDLVKINIRRVYTGTHIDKIIQLGNADGNFYGEIEISGVFSGAKAQYIVYCYPGGRDVILDNIICRNMNPDGYYTNAYVVGGSSNNPIIIRHMTCHELNHFDPIEDLTKVEIISVEGDAKFKNSGTATFSGDGTTTQFSIAHGLVSTPTKVLVTPMTADAASDFYVTADDTNIYINYKSAPPSGTDNLKFSWYAEV